VLVISLIGFIDATYLTVEHYKNVVPPCSITEGCEDVLTSTYAVVGGIPVALAGAVYYFLILASAFAYLESKNSRFLKFAFGLTVLGFLASLWFVYLQFFVINSLCAYCLVSALTSILLFIAAIYVFSRKSPADTLPA